VYNMNNGTDPVSEIPSSSSRAIDAAGSPPNIEMGSGNSIAVRSTWVGFQKFLYCTENQYLQSLHLGNPSLIDQFSVSVKGGTSSDSMCVLFPRILLLFRKQNITDSARSSQSVGYPQEPETESEKWSIYGVMFPRHIAIVSARLNGVQKF
jgi:hypothetical protein